MSQHRHDGLQVGGELFLPRLRVGGGCPAEVGELHAVLLGKGLFGLPEQIGVHGVWRAMREVVVLEIAAPFAGLEPAGVRRLVGVIALGQAQQHAGDIRPLAALLCADHPPAVRAEPVDRRAVYHLADRLVVDAEVVPVDQEVQVVQPQPPGGVHHLVVHPGGQPGFAFHGKDLHALRSGALERHRLAGCRRAAVSGGTGVELEEQGLAFHLGVTG